DLAWRCSEGRLDAKASSQSRVVRKQALTATCTSRWAGAITRTSEDTWGLAERNLLAEQRSLRARVGRLRQRLAGGAGGRQGRAGGGGAAARSTGGALGEAAPSPGPGDPAGGGGGPADRGYAVGVSWWAPAGP